MPFEININGDKRLVNKLGVVGDVIKNPKKILQETGKFIISEVDKQFDEQGRRLSSGWKALKENTLLEKARMGFSNKGILERTGNLRKGFTAALSNFMVRVHNPVKYYPYHQLGDRKLPKREMLSTPEKVKQEIVAIFIKNIRESIK